MATILEQLAEFSCSLKLKNIPTKVVDHAKLCIMDAIECCVSSETERQVLLLRSKRMPIFRALFSEPNRGLEWLMLHFTTL